MLVSIDALDMSTQSIPRPLSIADFVAELRKFPEPAFRTTAQILQFMQSTAVTPESLVRTVEEFLAETCRKAGLAPGAWRGPETQIFGFTCEAFSDGIREATKAN